MKKVTLAGLSALALFAFSCGGGGGDIGFPIGGGGGIRINSFNVSPTTINVDTTFTADWNITTSNAASMALYAYSQPTLPSGDAKYEYVIAQGGGSYGPGTFTGGYVCTLMRGEGNSLVTDCSLKTGQQPYKKTLKVRGRAYLILEACTLVLTSTGIGVDMVCDRRSVAVTFPQ